MKNNLFSEMDSINDPLIITDKMISKIIHRNSASILQFKKSSNPKKELKPSDILFVKTIKTITKQIIDLSNNNSGLIENVLLKLNKKEDGYYNINFSAVNVNDKSCLKIIFKKLNAVKETTSELGWNFKEMFDYSNDSIIIFNPQKEVILDFNDNASELYGYTAEKFTGMPLTKILKNIELERRYINEILLNGEKKNFESIHLTSNHKEIYLKNNAKLILYDNYNAVLLISRDITIRKKSESALIESERKFRELFESNPLIQLLADPNGNLLSINKNGAELLGFESKQLINKPLIELFAKNDRAKIDEQIKWCLDNPNKQTFSEMKMLNKDGAEIWVRETACTILGKNRYPEILVVCDDITFQKNAEVNAKNLAESLQSMLDASPLGVLVFRLNEDEEFILLTTNQSAVNILQINLYQLISKKIQDIFPNLDQKEIIEKYKVVAKTGLEHSNQIINYGDIHFRGTYEYSVIRIADRTIAVFFTDITEKYKAVHALTESELKFKTLFESANDAILLIKDDIVIDCNLRTTQLFKCGKDKIIGQTPGRFSPKFQPDGKLSMDKSKEKIKLCLAEGIQYFEWKHLTFDGITFDAEINLNKIKIHGESYIQAIVRDITERKKSEGIISEQRREFKTLLSNLPGMAYRCANNTNRTMNFINDGCYQLTGYLPNELIEDRKLSYSEVLHKDDRKMVNDYMQDAVEKKEPFTLLYRIMTADGIEKWV